MSLQSDLQKDKLVTLARASQLLPRKPSPATFWRWRTKGILLNGQRIRLECVRVGGVWCTTANAFADFLQRQTEAASEPQAVVGRSEGKSEKLKKAGLLSRSDHSTACTVGEQVSKSRQKVNHDQANVTSHKGCRSDSHHGKQDDRDSVAAD